MKKKKQLLLFSVLSVTAIFFLFLMLTGCSDPEPAEFNPYPNMPLELQHLQGAWTDENTNDLVECAAIIQGFTIRIRYQQEPESIMRKQNASIDRIDTQRNVILLNGGTGAWPYALEKDGNEEQLTLEFYSTDGWHTLHLCRAD